ncbi:hypothetical protein [Pigmentiphaga daeguensis]|uniref:Uncharacterized protein n=1 Tax=Pigmentiphaga daeguensis TaxID=414049 RepID=A0ABP3L4Q2_9BURK
MKSTLVHHLYDFQRPGKPIVCSSEVSGPRGEIERSPFLAGLLPAAGRKFAGSHLPAMPGVRVKFSRLKSGDVRLAFLRSPIWRNGEPQPVDVGLDDLLHEAMAAMRAADGRPAGWPFPTWGGAHGC